MIKIINEDSLECLFKIKDDFSLNPFGKKTGHIELKSAVKMDNSYENQTQFDGNHLIVDPKVLKPCETFERLIRINHRYKSGLAHAKNFMTSQSKAGKRSRANFDLLSQIYSIDYS